MDRRRYVSDDDDSARWDAFPYRDGDVVISTRSKHGTTWMQMIVLLLIHQRPDLPGPLPVLSPWIDHRVEPIEDVVGRLDAQRHRRVLKTHTPLDGLPLHDGATYLVVARHPLDAAVSLWHQRGNIDRRRLGELVGQVLDERPRPDLATWLEEWIDRHADPTEMADSLPGVLAHLTDAWQRREAPNVALFHYADLSSDLSGQMRRVAQILDVEVPTDRWDTLVEAATLPAMRARAHQLTPDALGVLRDKQAFFREGRSGTGADVLSADALARYHRRAAELAPPDLLDWLHR